MMLLRLLLSMNLIIDQENSANFLKIHIVQSKWTNRYKLIQINQLLLYIISTH